MTPVVIVAAALIPYALLLLGLGLTVVTDLYISRFNKRIMILILTLTASLIVQNAAEYLLAFGTPHIGIRTLVGIYGYAVRPAIIVLFYYFVSRSKKLKFAWALTGINAIIYLSALFSPVAFAFRSDNTFVRGPLGFAGHIVSAILLFGLFLLVVTRYSKAKSKTVFPITGILLIIIAVFLDTFLPVTESLVISALTIAVVMSCIFNYFWLHVQFVQQYETNLMAEQRIKIMVSQIQPHFLYNTIATIRALCKSDPDKAAEVSEKFGQYLRQNLDSLDTPNLISFDKELEHTQVYADIEMVRFENIRVEYDINDNAFSLPPLTVQPIVENAIRHGVRIRKEGVVRVSTRLSENYHEIVISDNGIGFDVNKTADSDGKHIGIKNVRERVEKLCGGTLVLESEPGVGTTATIRIPDKEAAR